MKKLTKSVAAIASIGLISLGGLAFAGEGMDHPRKMEKFDTNKDGQLSETERQAMKAFKQEKHAAREAELLGKYDANKNGQLDESERQRAHQERSAELFKKLDTDGNGSLSLAEFQAMKPGGHGRHGMKRK